MLSPVIIRIMNMNNRVTIITGAGRGVGRATAQLFACAGARVVLFSRTASQLEEVMATIVNAGGSALNVMGDVAREEDVLALFQQVKEHYGRLDILVNCAGYSGCASIC